MCSTTLVPARAGSITLKLSSNWQQQAPILRASGCLQVVYACVQVLDHGLLHNLPCMHAYMHLPGFACHSSSRRLIVAYLPQMAEQSLSLHPTLPQTMQTRLTPLSVTQSSSILVGTMGMTPAATMPSTIRWAHPEYCSNACHTVCCCMLACVPSHEDCMRLLGADFTALSVRTSHFLPPMLAVQFWSDFGALLDVAHANGIGLIPVLWDFHAMTAPVTANYSKSQCGHVQLFTNPDLVTKFIDLALIPLVRQ